MEYRRNRNPAKVFLSRYRALSVQEESIRAEIQRKRDALTNVSAQLKPDVVMTSGSGDKMADGVAQIVDEEAQFAGIVEQIQRTKMEIVDAIKSVDNEMSKAVLILRYIEGLDWITIADRIGYAERQTFVFHGLGLVDVNRWLTGKRAQENADKDVVL